MTLADGTIVTMTPRAKSRTTSGRVFALAPWCLLVFALVLLHLTLMASEHHAATTASPHAGMLVADANPAAIAMSSVLGRSDHEQPHSTLNGCPVGQAILPLILLLLGIVGVVYGRPILRAIGVSSAICRASLAAPPLLPPAQRRALLQIFII